MFKLQIKKMNHGRVHSIQIVAFLQQTPDIKDLTKQIAQVFQNNYNLMCAYYAAFFLHRLTSIDPTHWIKAKAGKKLLESLLSLVDRNTFSIFFEKCLKS